MKESADLRQNGPGNLGIGIAAIGRDDQQEILAAIRQVQTKGTVLVGTRVIAAQVADGQHGGMVLRWLGVARPQPQDFQLRFRPRPLRKHHRDGAMVHDGVVALHPQGDPAGDHARNRFVDDGDAAGTRPDQDAQRETDECHDAQQSSLHVQQTARQRHLGRIERQHRPLDARFVFLVFVDQFRLVVVDPELSERVGDDTACVRLD